jgi:hypothetical protein
MLIEVTHVVYYLLPNPSLLATTNCLFSLFNWSLEDFYGELETKFLCLCVDNQHYASYIDHWSFQGTHVHF